MLVGHVEVNGVSFVLPDGRVLLDDVTFRVGEGAKVALVGPNGAGKTTLLRIIAGDLDASDGPVTRSGGLGVMRQFVGKVRDELDGARPAALGGARPRCARPRPTVDRAELAMMERDDEPTQLRYAQALADWADAGGYDAEVLWDVCTVAALGVPFERAQWREVRTLSGGEQKRLVLEALLRGPDEVLLLDEPDNYLDVPGQALAGGAAGESPKTVLFVSHDRELLADAATRVVTLELGAAGQHRLGAPGGGFATYHAGPQRPVRPARGAAPALGRGARQAQGAGADVQAEGRLQRRHGLALPGRRDPAAQVRGGRPAETRAARAERRRCGCAAARTGKRAVVCERPGARPG